TATPHKNSNITASLANKGFFYPPHIVKEIEGKPQNDPRFTQPKKTLVDKEHFYPVLDGMTQVFTSGTASYYKTKSFTQAGKTGTAQNPHGQDHSLVTLIAPVANPKIVIAVVVENGYGADRGA